jgi:excisionase family DNA binding protein
MPEVHVKSKLMTLSEVAGYLRVTEKTIHRLLSRKAIPATRVGRLWRFDIEAIDKWLRESSISDKARILIIDNDRSVLTLLGETVDRLGREASVAESGKAGLKLLEEHRFSLVFLNMDMPEMDSVETFGCIRDACPDIPVVVMVGDSDSKLMSTALSYGPFGVLNKPFRESDIVQIINSLVRI